MYTASLPFGLDTMSSMECSNFHFSIHTVHQVGSGHCTMICLLSPQWVICDTLGMRRVMECTLMDQSCFMCFILYPCENSFKNMFLYNALPNLDNLIHLEDIKWILFSLFKMDRIDYISDHLVDKVKQWTHIYIDVWPSVKLEAVRSNGRISTTCRDHFLMIAY